MSALILLGHAAATASETWRGAAFEGDRASLARLAEAGAKVVRTYRASDAWVLDEAQQLGMKVVMGLWLEHPRHGFDYADAAALRAQEEAVLETVVRYRDHPALLAWGVGNEIETGVADPLPLWREVDRLAGLIEQLDPNHPTLMVVADTGMDAFRTLAGCCPNVDLLGINVYAGAIFDLPQRLREAGITKPVVVAELGPLGQWQAGRKPWGAPVELTSTEKARFFTEALAFLKDQPQIRGAFPFLWGAKQEQTATWHGLLLADRSQTAMTDALAAAWGRPVAKPAPVIRGIGIGADEFAPGAEISAGIDAVAHDGSELTTEWTVRAEATDLRKGGDAETPPPRVDVRVLHADAATVRFVAPTVPGAYRLFITTRDQDGKAATANLPFKVR
ncbi:glycoside hydrolase family 2 TIM barrel-domain containing protein [Thauera sp.]|uniref:glycoside hydrolase family 2 TIM barrel-domain containing protein n=1 Tax=Thauera sp. TaxID=1905334 RepID=UPI002CBE70B4|nr:glycoside hydrolase family 2 TIM barrel-domain containing protein [Thauera sp.]HRP24587.1 glycoside hydrolase family 2 TIM barrel-domain containing protein [Thauera sp.]